MEKLNTTLKNKLFRVFMAFVLVCGLSPAYAFASANESDGSSTEATTAVEENVTMSIDDYEAAKAAANASSTTAATTETATTAENTSAQAAETYPLSITLESTDMQTGDSAMKVELQKKSGTEWTKVKELSLTAGTALEVKDLTEDTYRVVLADEVYTHVDGTKSVLADEMSVVTTNINKVKTDKGFEFNPTVKTEVKIHVKAVEETNTEATDNASQSTTEKNQTAKTDDDDEADSNVVEGDYTIEEGTEINQTAALGTLLTEGNGEYPNTATEQETITFNVVGEGTIEVSYEGVDSQMISDGDSITLPKDTYVHVVMHNPNSDFIEVSYEDYLTGTEVSGAKTTCYDFDYWTDITANQSWRITISFDEFANGGGISVMSWDQPTGGESFSGSCYVTYVDGGGGHTVNGVGIYFTDGILAGVSADGDCGQHSAADPDVGQDYWYSWTVYSIDYNSGTVTGSVWCTSKEDPSDGVTSNAYGLIGYQALTASGISIHRDYGGYAKVKKSSACPSVSTGNSNYSLADAQYGIYSDSNCNNLLATLTTDANGDTSSTGWLDHGTYYCKELVAPKGFELNETAYSFSISGGTTTVNVEDTAWNDPAAMWVGKIDREVNMNRPQGSASLSGALFTVKYYQDSTIATYEDAEDLTPTRTWVVKTDEDGYAELADSYKVSGDDFFYNQEGFVTIPIGSITIEETSAPIGYLLNSENKYIQNITEEGLSADIPVSYNAPTVPEQIIRGGISVSKTLVGGDNEELEGIGFAIVSKTTGERMSWTDENGNTVDTLYLDKTGKATTPNDALVYDTYQLVELADTVSSDIMLYGNSQTEFTQIVGEQTITENHAIYNQDVVDYEKIDLDLIKIDGDSLRDNGGSEVTAERVAGSEWQLTYGDKVVFSGTTDENGVLDFPRNAIDRFGTYTLTEVKAANQDQEDGYMSADASGMPESVSFTVNEETYEKILNGTYEGEAGDSWTFEMVDGKAAIVKTTQNWKYRFVEAVKKDLDDDSPIVNTKYGLYHYIGDEADYSDDSGIRGETHDTYITDPTESIDSSVWELVKEGYTDSNGSFITKGLVMGHYMVVEEQPALTHMAWWESGDGTTWDRYYFEASQANPQHQTQIFRNDKIEIETTVDKQTIARTSAAFNSLPNQVVDYQNVNSELYYYKVDFTNGETNCVADQYAVVDQLEPADMGLRMQSLWTPILADGTDYDGTYNIWVKTAKGVTGGSADAKAGNPDNPNTDGTDRISTDGYLLWAEGLSAYERTQLDVADLGLDSDDYVTEIMLEFGAVNPGFATEMPMTYNMLSTQQFSGDTVIPNTVTSHITRNWNAVGSEPYPGASEQPGIDTGDNGYGLKDDAIDKVETRVIDTMQYDSVTNGYVDANGNKYGMLQTGDDNPYWLIGIFAGIAVIAAGGVVALRRRTNNN